MAQRFSAVVGVAFLLGGLLSSCAGAKPGPQAWIDTPLDGTTAPLAPLVIMAHASAEGGISSIEFAINEQPHLAVAADGERLVWRQIEWTPPQAGTYAIGARGVSPDGTAGPYAIAMVVVSDEASLPIPIPGPESLPVPIPGPESLPVPIPQPESPAVLAKMNANCREGPGTAFQAEASLLEGEQADIIGRLADNSWLLLRMESGTQCWIAASVVDATGLAEVPVAAAPPPPVEVLPPAEVQTDTTAPGFFSVAAGPEVIGIACGPTTTTIAAAVGDDVALASVTAHWSLAGKSGQAGMSLGGLGYYTVLGPMSDEGTMSVYVVAVDTSGNSSTSSTMNVTVAYCP
jgi:hypothetical protein